MTQLMFCGFSFYYVKVKSLVTAYKTVKAKEIGKILNYAEITIYGAASLWRRGRCWRPVRGGVGKEVLSVLD